MFGREPEEAPLGFIKGRRATWCAEQRRFLEGPVDVLITDPPYYRTIGKERRPSPDRQGAPVRHRPGRTRQRRSRRVRRQASARAGPSDDPGGDGEAEPPPDSAELDGHTYPFASGPNGYGNLRWAR